MNWPITMPVKPRIRTVQLIFGLSAGAAWTGTAVMAGASAYRAARATEPTAASANEAPPWLFRSTLTSTDRPGRSARP